MSLNMFPNELGPTDQENLDYDTVLPRGPGAGDGPYGSYNDDDGEGVTGPLETGRHRSLSLNDMDHPPKYASVDDIQGVLDRALQRAQILLNPVLADAISDLMALVDFNAAALGKADDLLETAIYLEMQNEVAGLNPVALVEFLDQYMSQNRGRVAVLEELLMESYRGYWEARLQEG